VNYLKPRFVNKKRRFGISIPERLAKSLDALTQALGADRSSLIREALREYLHDHSHYLKPHECGGVMILLENRDHMYLLHILEEYDDIVCNYNHVHVGRYCIDIVVVSGSSSRIAHLHNRLLSELKCRIRYIPIGKCSLELAEDMQP